MDTDSDNDGLLDHQESGNPYDGSTNDRDGDGLYDVFEGSNINDVDADDEIDNPYSCLMKMLTDHLEE